jgi:hypothetical protein
MKSMFRIHVLLSIVVLTMVSCAVWAAQMSIKLILDGKVVSNDVQTIQGRVYVPLSDVAKVLKRSVVRKNGTYSLVQAIEGNPREGLPGKMGTDLFSGPWRLKVTSVQQVATYSPLYGSDKQPITPREVGDVLVVITCRLNNGTSDMQEISFDRSYSGNTALMDDQERGYVPLAYDTRNSGYTSAKIPPGTTLDFVVLFSVPKGANLTALTYSVKGTDRDTSRDFRVSLTP